MSDDLVQRLRDRAYSGLPDPLSEQAADEIERLRSRLRLVDAVIRSGDVAALTDAEREAIDAAAHAAAQLYAGQEGVALAATLRGLLDRLHKTL